LSIFVGVLGTVLSPASHLFVRNGQNAQPSISISAFTRVDRVQRSLCRNCGVCLHIDPITPAIPIFSERLAWSGDSECHGNFQVPCSQTLVHVHYQLHRRLWPHVSSHRRMVPIVSPTAVASILLDLSSFGDRCSGSERAIRLFICLVNEFLPPSPRNLIYSHVLGCAGRVDLDVGLDPHDS
jgi:hypothetical protein